MRKVCILSKAEFEPTTERVIDWLNAVDVPWIRLNQQALTQPDGTFEARIYQDASTHLTFRSGDQLFSSQDDEIAVVWYRRWKDFESYYSQSPFDLQDIPSFLFNHASMCMHLDRELTTASEFLFRQLSSCTWLSSPLTSRLNKLIVLEQARNCGLAIPDSLISTDTDHMRQFLRVHGAVITKPLSEALMFLVNSVCYTSFTTEVTEALLDALDRPITPILLQEKLPKKYEIRSFMLDDKFYSMAVFSQSRRETMIDMRRLPFGDTSCRNVPYQLNRQTENKLLELSRLLDLDTCSFDLIKTPDGREVFLEVNPIGQLEVVSIECNYYLEREIALALKRRVVNVTGPHDAEGE